MNITGFFLANFKTAIPLTTVMSPGSLTAGIFHLQAQALLCLAVAKEPAQCAMNTLELLVRQLLLKCDFSRRMHTYRYLRDSGRLVGLKIRVAENNFWMQS